MNNIDKFTLDEWLTTLKPYQSKSMKELIENLGENKAIDAWLLANGSNVTSPFGGDANGNFQFTTAFKNEFKKFVCGDPQYNKYREEISKHNIVTTTVIVSVVTTALSTVLGVAAAFIAPAVVASLYAASKIGINAWCSIS